MIDGLDGSGKSTQAQLILNSLNREGKTVILRNHPEDDNFFGIKASQFLLSRGKSAHFAAALFYIFDVIRSILIYSWRKVDYIIFVRYLMGAAYLPSPLHKIAYLFFALVLPRPKKMIFLDAAPKVALSRIEGSRGKKEMFEDLDSLEKVRVKALSLVLRGKWIIMNSNGPSMDIAAAIRKIVCRS